MTSHSHFINRCYTHGTVLSQCRCPSPGKSAVYMSCPGPKLCSAAKKEEADKSTEEPS